MLRTLSSRPHARTTTGGLLATVAAGVLLTACGAPASTDASQQPTIKTASAQTGPLHITGAYIPRPANPDVAAAYLVVTDGGSADALTGVTSSASTDVGLHKTVEHGNVGTMVPVPAIDVPAHGKLVLQPGGFHIMLMHPQPLTIGQHVALTLHFAHAAAVSLQVPVVPLTATNDDTGSMPMNMDSTPMNMGS